MNGHEDECLNKVIAHQKETAKIASVVGLLEWDERTIMPPAAGEYRAEQISCLSGLVHQRNTAPELGQWLGELAESSLASDPHSDTGATIRCLHRDFQRDSKIPQRLAEEIARQSVLGQQAWVQAREKDDFASFAPTLEKIYDLAREKAQALGYEASAYDPLLDEYEPEEKTADVTSVLAELREQLVPLVAAIRESGREPNLDILRRHYPNPIQEQFSKDAAAAVGFDFQRGRLDETHHPFCAGMGPSDCRITTRYDENFFPSCFFSVLHEAGHGIYDQGVRTDQFGLPPGTYVSLGIHESQSRLWENLVGRSHAFWRHFYPRAQELFPAALRDVPLDDFFFAINDVRPSLIRVEADEATYNLHIIIRFELEQELIQGDLKVADLPEAWNGRYEKYLGIKPPNDADGVLQDVHWSASLIGYFPTYSLGNLYSAQLYQQAAQELPGMEEGFARGEFLPLTEWLQKKVHQPGRCFPPRQLIQQITGSPLSVTPLIEHLRGKLAPLYGLSD